QALLVEFFADDADGFYCISDKCKPKVEQLREALIAADPSYAPLLKQPPSWTGWSKTCDGFEATFVRDWHPETKKAINDAFLDPLWDHARGVNALSKVPLKIDTEMLPLVERFALAGKHGIRSEADETKVKADLADAKYCGNRAFWNDYNCDWRGRINALQH